MARFSAYHRVDAATHWRRVEELGAAGFRPVVLDVSGDPSDARYAAVWVDRPGPEWRVAHDLRAEDYQARLEELTRQGFAPTIVSATGPVGGERFAAVFEQGVEAPWFARQGLRWGPATDPNTLTHENGRAFDQGQLPRCLAMYGDPSDRRFAGVWVQNTDAVLWSWWLTGPGDYGRFSDALTRGGMRPAALSVGPDGSFLSVFRGDQVGRWHERHDMTADQYQAEFDLRVSEGLRPIAVAAGGAGDRARYAAVFAEDDVPTPRRWSVSGAGFAGADALDQAVRRFMVRRGVPGGLGGHRPGRGHRRCPWLHLGRARIPGHPASDQVPHRQPEQDLHRRRAQPPGRERPAVVDHHRLSRVGISSALPNGTSATPGMDAITVQQLVVRTSHLPRDLDQEQRTIAAILGVGAAPIGLRPLLRYLYGRPLVDAIPADGLYSNAAFFLLTAVVEQASGLPFVAALERDVLEELDIHDVEVGSTTVGARQPNEVATYDHAGLHASQLDFAPLAMAPDAYGGSFVLENGAGSGGLVTSAPSITRLIARYPVWNADSWHLSGRELNTRYGAFDGTAAGATSRRDGLDFAFLFNRRVGDAGQDAILHAIHGVLNTHGHAL